MSEPALATAIEADSYVENPRMREWGPGRVMQIEGAKAVVCFRDAVAEAPGDGLKTMVLRSLEPSGVQSDPWLDNLPPFKQGRFQVSQPRVTLQQGVDELVRQFAGGFADASYLERERAPRESAHALFVESLGGGQGERLLAGGDSPELAKRALEVAKRAGVLNRVELAVLREGLADGAGAKNLFGALFDLLGLAGEPGPALAGYLEAFAELSLQVKTAPSKWSLATALPFVARPDAFLLLKPEVSKPAAERLRFDLAYHVEPNPRTWDKQLRMGRALLERLAPLGAQDLIDVHAYLGFVSRYGSSRAHA